jgi:hypothetical protein
MSGCALDCQWWGAYTRAFILLLWLNHAGHDSRGMGKLSHVKMPPHSITSTKASPSLCLVNYIKCFTLSCENCSFQHISTSFCWPTLVKNVIVFPKVRNSAIFQLENEVTSVCLMTISQLPYLVCTLYTIICHIDPNVENLLCAECIHSWRISSHSSTL